MPSPGCGPHGSGPSSKKGLCTAAALTTWRKRWDSNPRYLSVRLISSQVHSATLPLFLRKKLYCKASQFRCWTVPKIKANCVERKVAVVWLLFEILTRCGGLSAGFIHQLCQGGAVALDSGPLKLLSQIRCSLHTTSHSSNAAMSRGLKSC